MKTRRKLVALGAAAAGIIPMANVAPAQADNPDCQYMDQLGDRLWICLHVTGSVTDTFFEVMSDTGMGVDCGWPCSDPDGNWYSGRLDMEVVYQAGNKWGSSNWVSLNLSALNDNQPHYRDMCGQGKLGIGLWTGSSDPCQRWPEKGTMYIHARRYNSHGQEIDANVWNGVFGGVGVTPGAKA